MMPSLKGVGNKKCNMTHFDLKKNSKQQIKFRSYFEITIDLWVFFKLGCKYYTYFIVMSTNAYKVIV